MSGTLLYENSCGDNHAAAESATFFGFSPAILTVTTGRLLGSCYKLNNQTCVTGLAAASAHTTHHFAFKVDNLSNTQDVYLVREGASSHVTVRLITGTGALAITRAGTVLATGPAGAVSPGVWVHIGLDVTIHDTAGAFTLYLNGVSHLTGSGLDTRNGGTGVADTIGLFGNGSSNTYFDDMHVWDGSDFKGDTRVIGQVANAAGATTTWTPNAGTNISRVSEATSDGDTTYNSDSTSGHIDTFGFPAVSVGSGATVHAVCPYVIARKDDAGARSLALVTRRGGTNYAGATQSLTTSYARYREWWLQDPSTGADWASVADVDAGEYGYKDV